MIGLLIEFLPCAIRLVNHFDAHCNGVKDVLCGVESSDVWHGVSGYCREK